MKIETSQTIAIARISDKTYIVPLWLEVPADTQLSDIEVVKPVKKQNNPVIIEEYVTGSKGDEYLVKVLENGESSCECWGYKRHKKDCKHIRLVKSKIKEG
jgi:D-alanine-D-alanine ligase-like ATP-grasp enzyme